MKTAGKVMQYLDIDNVSTADDHISSYRSTMHSCFNLGFEVRKGKRWRKKIKRSRGRREGGRRKGKREDWKDHFACCVAVRAGGVSSAGR